MPSSLSSETMPCPSGPRPVHSRPSRSPLAASLSRNTRPAGNEPRIVSNYDLASSMFLDASPCVGYVGILCRVFPFDFFPDLHEKNYFDGRSPSGDRARLTLRLASEGQYPGTTRESVHVRLSDSARTGLSTVPLSCSRASGRTACWTRRRRARYFHRDCARSRVTRHPVGPQLSLSLALSPFSLVRRRGCSPWPTSSCIAPSTRPEDCATT